jgi:septal ring factor EnvC (AmiA/AmiB activator)
MPSQTASSASQAPPPDASSAPRSGLHRAFDAIRSTLPLVQKILPIIDGNIATAVSALMTAQPHPAPHPQQVHINLEPIEHGLAEIRNSNRELRGQVQEQVTNLKRVEDQLERIREATDRNTLEQQELVEDLRSASGRISTFAILGATLLAISLGLNIYLIIQLQHILR